MIMKNMDKASPRYPESSLYPSHGHATRHKFEKAMSVLANGGVSVRIQRIAGKWVVYDRSGP